MDRMILDQQTFLEGSPEYGAVRGGSIKVGIPGIQVRVEVHERDRAPHGRNRTEHGQCDGVIAADRYYPAAPANQIRGMVADLGHRSLNIEGSHRPVARVGHLYSVDWREPEHG